jgi:hypothetical protein
MKKSPRGSSEGGEDRKLACDGVRFCSSFGEGVSSRWWTSDDRTRSSGGGVTSLFSPSGQQRLGWLQTTR